VGRIERENKYLKGYNMVEMTDYQKYIHKSRYARWLETENRRENWEETVKRYFDFFEKHLKEKFDWKMKERKELESAVLNMEIMPSMRALMTAGPALERDNIAGYNCAAVTVNRIRAFDEAMYVLMNGTGMGFSVERREVEKLPEVPEELYPSDTTIHVTDSKLGWSKSFKELISLLYAGHIPKWDTSKIRPKGERLKTFGGRASGPDPLESLFRFTAETFKIARGRKLSSIECHDIMCKIAEIVVVGGVRRSALISLSNLTDERMRKAKSGQWWMETPHRALANNSVVYTEPPDVNIFLKEWLSLIESKSGERGIVNRNALKKQVKRLGDRRDPDHDFLLNPCAEIILRDREFCNLSEIIVREHDTEKTIKEKVRLATILGTFQATLIDFKYISSEWAKNCKEEALLGVSMTGIMDNPLTYENKNGKLDDMLGELNKYSVKINSEYAKAIGINPAAAVTCVKPSGTVSQLVDASSGIHTRHSPYYIRTVRCDKKDPISQFMKDQGVPCEDDVTKPDNTYVFSFPTKSPSHSVFRNDKTAIEQLETWKIYHTSWCEHNPSVTITVREHEWIEVGAWVYSNFNEIGGVSFLPHSDHTYRQAPYQECGKEEYEKMSKLMPKNIDWDKLSEYEKEDNTIGSQELACSGNSCELVDMS
jgi:ribonucleoside-diphosphate reductase alpha chain|tara:strand:+ start:129 stop:2090 length:1962 start_codon:yes stop_codon:yes gene_type:complete